MKKKNFLDRFYAGYCKKCREKCKKEFASAILIYLTMALIILIVLIVTYLINNNIIPLTLSITAFVGLILLFHVYFNNINLKLKINFRR